MQNKNYSWSFSIVIDIGGFFENKREVLMTNWNVLYVQV